MAYQGPNAVIAEYWNETMGPTWVELRERLDAEIEPFGAAAMRALAPAPGERILDIGCGCGQTSWQLAERTGPAGTVGGFDLSRTMLELARGRPASLDTAPPSFIEGDAQVANLGTGFDAVFSRFGWMFFSDPTAAFANIRKSLRPGGRLAMVTWRTLAENPLFTVPAEAAAPYLDPSPPPQPDTPGPFRYGDFGLARQALADAGFLDIAAAPFDAPAGVKDLDGALLLALRLGPLGAAIRQAPALRERVSAAVREALGRFQTSDGINIPAAVWIVTAKA